MCLRSTPIAIVTKMLTVNLLQLGLYRNLYTYVQLEKAPKPASTAVGGMLTDERTNQPTD